MYEISIPDICCHVRTFGETDYASDTYKKVANRVKPLDRVHAFLTPMKQKLVVPEES